MQSKIIKSISYLLTILLICGIYTETGVFTTVFAFFVFVYFEVNTRFIVATSVALRAVAKFVDKVSGNI